MVLSKHKTWRCFMCLFVFLNSYIGHKCLLLGSNLTWKGQAVGQKDMNEGTEDGIQFRGGCIKAIRPGCPVYPRCFVKWNLSLSSPGRLSSLIFSLTFWLCNADLSISPWSALLSTKSPFAGERLWDQNTQCDQSALSNINAHVNVVQWIR